MKPHLRSRGTPVARVHVVVGMLWLTAFGGAPFVHAAPTQPAAPARGIAVLASGIGKAYSAQALAEFAHRGGFSPVVVDWAWITAHWEKTDFSEVNRLVATLSAKGIQVAAMYRPRFLGAPTVPIQVKSDGTPYWPHGSHICYSSDQARRWGAAWGARILENCSGFDEIIIYNPLNQCQCTRCAQAREADPFAHYDAVWSFLAEARTAWRVRKPQVKLGVVFMPELDFWARGKEIVDVARPFLIVREDTDMAQNIAEVRAVRDALKERVGACLAKVTWAPGEKVSTDRLSTFDRLCSGAAIPYFFWTFDTLFLSEMYEPGAVAQAIGIEHGAIEEPLLHMRTRQPILAAGQVNRYTSKDIQGTDAETFFERLAQPQPGYDAFSAMWALQYKGMHGEAAERKAIVERAIEVMLDRTRALHQRWQCCYVLSGIGDERGVPPLAQVLHGDPNETMRGVAACALGKFSSAEATRALEQAAEGETSALALGAINRALRGEFRGVPPPATSKGARLPVEDVLAGKHVALVLVKDFLRMENTGPALKDVEFERYFPAVDSEQIVIARWVSAQADAGEVIPVSLAKVQADVQGNLIHTWRLSRFPEQQQVLVTVTSLVARRERPAPRGDFPIPPANGYPPAVRPFLSATAMVAADHPEVKEKAAQLLAGMRDAYGLAQRLAAVMKAKSYKQTQRPEAGLPTAVAVLRYGGSCCSSAVCAAAVLRACGIPAQLTYAPGGYIHGVVRFYLNSYGWVRMDATCGTGKLPLAQKEADLGMVRLLDMPIEMESMSYAYMWPYCHNDAVGRYQFRSEGRPCAAVRFAHKGQPGPDGVAGRVAQPFPHLESGSWNRVLGSQPFEGAWQSWDVLVEASTRAVREGRMGEFDALTAKLPGLEGFTTLAQSWDAGA